MFGKIKKIYKMFDWVEVVKWAFVLIGLLLFLFAIAILIGDIIFRKPQVQVVGCGYRTYTPAAAEVQDRMGLESIDNDNALRPLSIPADTQPLLAGANCTHVVDNPAEFWDEKTLASLFEENV